MSLNFNDVLDGFNKTSEVIENLNDTVENTKSFINIIKKIVPFLSRKSRDKNIDVTKLRIVINLVKDAVQSTTDYISKNIESSPNLATKWYYVLEALKNIQGANRLKEIAKLKSIYWLNPEIQSNIDDKHSNVIKLTTVIKELYELEKKLQELLEWA